jgi:hypothetical protein
VTQYTIFANLKAIQPLQGSVQTPQALGQSINMPPGSAGIFISGGAGGVSQPPVNQTFQFVVVGQGAVSGQAQPLVCNDGINWMPLGSAVSATGAHGVATVSITGTNPFAYYSGQLQSISGNNAAASLIMNV